MHRRGWTDKGIIIQVNKKILLFNCCFNESLYFTIIIVMMVMAKIAFHDVDKFSIISIDFTIRRSVEIQC